MVVGDAPLALLLGDVGHGGGVGAGEHDLGAGVEQRGGAVALHDRVMPGVDEPDVHRALGAGPLTPRMIALPRRSSSGIGKVAM